MAKLEFFNPGGSIKDRVAKRMIEDAEERNLLVPGKSTIIEATSGNTGIGLALNGAVRGYEVIITLPEKMSQEKSDILAALGATIIRTPTEAKVWEPESHMGVAKRLNKEIEDSFRPDQYANSSNPNAHYDETAEEIWEQCEGKLDAVVIAAGTGGTLTGIGRKLKEKNKNIKIIGVDPYGSILAFPDELNTGSPHGYSVEGIGSDFIPINCNREIADKWYKVKDIEAFTNARRLIREEGLLVGGSAGACVSAAIAYARDLPPDKRVVCIFVDSITNYMTKHLNDDWMLEKNYLSQEEYDKINYSNKFLRNNIYGEEELISDLSLKEVPSVSLSSKVEEVLQIMKEINSEYLPVVDEKTELAGLISIRQLTNYLTSFKLTLESTIKKALIRDYKILKSSSPLKYLSKAFERHEFVLVTNGNNYYTAIPDNLLDHFLQNII